MSNSKKSVATHSQQSVVGDQSTADARAASYGASSSAYIAGLQADINKEKIDSRKILSRLQGLLELWETADGIPIADSDIKRLAGWYKETTKLASNNKAISRLVPKIENKLRFICAILHYDFLSALEPTGKVLRDFTLLRRPLAELRKIAKKDFPELVGDIDRFEAKVAGLEIGTPHNIATPPPRLSAAALAEFKAYAMAEENAWPGVSSLSPSEFIRHHYQKWLGVRNENGGWSGPTLWRSDIKSVMPKLAMAYTKQISRDSNCIIAELYVQPHQASDGLRRGTWYKTVSELSEEELQTRRRNGAAKQRRYDERRRNLSRRVP